MIDILLASLLAVQTPPAEAEAPADSEAARAEDEAAPVEPAEDELGVGGPEESPEGAEQAEEAEEEEGRTVCRRTQVTDRFGRLRSTKTCRPE